MRNNKNFDNDSQWRGSQSGNSPRSSSQRWGSDRNDRSTHDSDYYSQSEGRYTELPEHDLQSSQRSNDRWSSARTDRGFSSDRDYRANDRDARQGRERDQDYSPSRGQYNQYRDDNSYNYSTREQDHSGFGSSLNSRYAQADRGQMNRDFGYGAAGNYSEYYRPSERTFDSGYGSTSRTDYGTGSRNAYRSANSDMDSDSYRGQAYGSNYSNGNSFDQQRSSSMNHAGRGPKGYTRTDDRIKEEVCDTLTRHPSIDASEIECDVKDGEVTLKGTVPERNMKLLAERVISDCQGVKDVSNQIKVQKDTQDSSFASSSSNATTSSMNGKTATSATDKKSSSSKAW